ncbi:DUF1801 domain-containing protein [Salinicoccus kekensis]|uniref:YdhG-like domain-containing protein n=1 Tax=Salinicoccus kekensis TaxID=714307 RepID=A0A285URW3_9STAP|nr:DUF1801 domain-containing protein [Salinicoccus kekensis]SOC44569.1 hypothetical protein SAMN05878391_2416 [Salinicoccus kekensis]
MSEKRTSEKVDAYIEGLSGEIKVITEELRAIILDTSEELIEELKWGMPNYSYYGLAAYLQTAKSHVNFGIHNGGKIMDKDTRKLLEGSGEKMKHIKVRSTDDIDRQYFQKLIEAIMTLNASE